MNIKEKAQQYAENKIKQALEDTISQAYMAGYEQGYRDRDANISADYTYDQVEYLDLGLPSGTLWASDFVKQDGDIVYLPYMDAKEYNLPTIEQVTELLSFCDLDYFPSTRSRLAQSVIVGLNGKVLRFSHRGCCYDIDKGSWADKEKAWFWVVNEDSIERNKTAACFSRDNAELKDLFSGFSLPILLVKNSH